jgi:hypothetical protein
LSRRLKAVHLGKYLHFVLPNITAAIKGHLTANVANIQIALKILQQAIGKKSDLPGIAYACAASRAATLKINRVVALRPVNDHARHIWQIIVSLSEWSAVSCRSLSISRRRAAHVNVQGVAGHEAIDEDLPSGVGESPRMTVSPLALRIELTSLIQQ